MNLAQELINRVKNTQKYILIVGDAMTDVWIHGERLESCQEGCAKFMETERVFVPGGAANAQRSLKGWGVRTCLISRASDNRPIKYRFVTPDGGIVFRHDDEHALRDGDYRWVLRDTMDQVARASAVLLSDYDKGFLTPDLIRDVVDLCLRRGIPCVADCKRDPLVYRGCQIKCNLNYYDRWCHRFLESERVVVTRGADSVVICPDLYMTPVLPPVKCVNHVGAGDCFASHLTLALAYGFSLKEAATIAHSAGRVYVQYPHNRPPKPEEIAADMDPDAARVRIDSPASGSEDGREPV